MAFQLSHISWSSLRKLVQDGQDMLILQLFKDYLLKIWPKIQMSCWISWKNFNELVVVHTQNSCILFHFCLSKLRQFFVISWDCSNEYLTYVDSLTQASFLSWNLYPNGSMTLRIHLLSLRTMLCEIFLFLRNYRSEGIVLVHWRKFFFDKLVSKLI